MSRYKGRSGAKSVERKFPHIVEMAVPLGGSGKRLNDMHEWHRARDIQPITGMDGTRTSAISFGGVFPDPNIAAAFDGTVQSSAVAPAPPP